MTMWGIHNDALSAEDLVEGNFVSLGWERMPDLRTIGDDREAMKHALSRHVPEAKSGAIPVWAGILLRFAFGMRVGDIVIAPNKVEGTLNFGRVTGPYRYEPDAKRHPHRREVEWVRKGVARSLFPQSALYEIGSALTLFRVKKHESIFAAFLAARSEEDFLQAPAATESNASDSVVAGTEGDSGMSELPTADVIEQNTVDFITRTLIEEFSDREFEIFTSDLLRAMGYEARATDFVGDGGIDVIAHRDLLGLQPPIIKVQCKHTAATMGRPEVQRLLGTLAPKDEHGLFVSLGTYSKEAQAVERERQNLRLLGAQEVSRLVMRHYDALPLVWRDRLPLRPVYVVERRPV